VVRRFPFLIGRNELFGRYKDKYLRDVIQISRCHAMIFLSGTTPFIKDLGSTNGTFVDGERLNEQAVPLENGVVVAFGGDHFEYRVRLKETLEIDSTATKVTPVSSTAPRGAGDSDEITVVASAGSFLDLFCGDTALHDPGAVPNERQERSDDVQQQKDRRRKRGSLATLLSGLTRAPTEREATTARLALWWAIPLMSLLGIFAVALYFNGAPEREIRDLLASGEYARATAMANEYLERHPDDAEINALSTEALLRAELSTWLMTLKTRDFNHASAILANMRQLGSHSTDIQPLLTELEWMGTVEKFVIERGGVDAPIQIYRDEEKIRELLEEWNEDTQRHQRAFATISSYVPEFKDAYAEMLSHLRRLQNDDSVYLVAIERLKRTIETELDRGTPETLVPILKDYSEKYPRLGGLDGVRRDLGDYIEVVNAITARSLSRLTAVLAKVGHSTPPFAVKFRALASSERFPPEDVIRQYEAVSEAWRQGDTSQAFTRLQRMGAGPWSDAASKALGEKKAILEQYTALARTRGAAGYEEGLLTFYGGLDPDEDVYFMRATAAEVGLYRDTALVQAQKLLHRAAVLWRQYREAGAIEGRQRLKAGISNEFRIRAQLLSEADQDAQRALRIYADLRVAQPPGSSKLREEIKTELELQRKSLMDLRHVLDAGPLKAKLALLGGKIDDRRKSP
jgi:pSer/pThr/pTyr-binding forkhead associated (FHA) protein